MSSCVGRLRTWVVGLAEHFDAGALSTPDALVALDDLEVIARVVDGLRMQTIKRVSESGAHVCTGERDAATFIAHKLHVPLTQVRNAIHTAEELEWLPATAAMARSGQLSGPEVRAIAHAATANPAAERRLITHAGRGLRALREECTRARAEVEPPKARRERQKRSQSWRTWTDADGMYAGSFRFLPEHGAQIDALVEGLRQKLFREHRAGKDHLPQEVYAAQAAISLLLGTANVGTNFTVHILLDHELLVRGGEGEGTCEIPGVGPVDYEWVRSIMGDAFLTAVIKKGVDITTVAHLGRKYPAELMTAMIVGGRECSIDGCGVRGYLERDHVHEVSKGGPSAWWNLAWLCYYHHQLKSRGWILGPPDPETGKRTIRTPN
jgi:hypothetical protein